MSHINESCHIWMSRVICEWVMSHVIESCHIWMSHVAHMNESCHDTSKLKKNVTLHHHCRLQCVAVHCKALLLCVAVCCSVIQYATPHFNTWYIVTYIRVMSHPLMSHMSPLQHTATHCNTLQHLIYRDIYTRATRHCKNQNHVAYEWVISCANESCPRVKESCHILRTHFMYERENMNVTSRAI